jgi:hypothetical protein
MGDCRYCTYDSYNGIYGYFADDPNEYPHNCGRKNTQCTKWFKCTYYGNNPVKFPHNCGLPNNYCGLNGCIYDYTNPKWDVHTCENECSDCDYSDGYDYTKRGYHKINPYKFPHNCDKDCLNCDYNEGGYLKADPKNFPHNCGKFTGHCEYYESFNCCYNEDDPINYPHDLFCPNSD